MKELKEISSNYAMERSNDLFSQVVAKAYADGYRQGYKDREDEIPADLRNNKTEFVDLGLTSGTLWSSTYERIGEEMLYLPYDRTKDMNIPTEDQWRELRRECRWSIDSDKLYCIGPNGNYIHFERTGYISIKKNKEIAGWSFFWIKNKKENGNECYSARMSWLTGSKESIQYIFRGYSLPIRLVNKQAVFDSLETEMEF